MKPIEKRLIAYAIIGGITYLLTPQREIYEIAVLLIFSIATMTDIWIASNPDRAKRKGK
jgi:hypothetical protein